MIEKQFLNEKELSDYLTEVGWPMAVSTLQNKRVSGGGPPFIKRGKVRYRRADVDKWLAKIPTLESTSQTRR